MIECSSLANIQELDLDFLLRVLGRTDAAVVPQRIGNWWLETAIDERELPRRARKRLKAVRESSLAIKAVVLFHEIADRPPHCGYMQRSGISLNRWLDQELSVLCRQVVISAQRQLPQFGAVAVKGGAVLLAGLGAAGLGVGALVLSAIAAAAADPCLVVVTEDGYWLEIDRWLS